MLRVPKATALSFLSGRAIPERKPCAQRLGAPGGAERICSVVLNADAFSGAKGGPDDAAPFFRVGPGDPLAFRDDPLVDSGAGDRTHGLCGVVLGKRHPRYAVAGFLADDAADVVEQGLLVDRAHQRLVAHADGSVFANQAGESLLRRPWRGALSADVQHV